MCKSGGMRISLSKEQIHIFADKGFIVLEADLGTVIFFDCYVPHGSPPNESERGRRNIYLTFKRQSDDNLRARYHGR